METIPAMANNRHSSAFSTSGVTSPTTPTGGESDYDQKPKVQTSRKPVGGIAVLPPMEMKRIENQRKTPTPTLSTDPKLKSSTATTGFKSPNADISEVFETFFCFKSFSNVFFYPNGILFLNNRVLFLFLFFFCMLF